MAFQPAPGVAEVRWKFEQDGSQMENIFHVFTTEEWTLEFVENLAAMFNDYWDTQVKAVTSDTVRLMSTEARDLGEEFGAFSVASNGTGIQGSLTSPAMPGNVTLALKWTTGLAGRSTRGRTYFVGLTEADCLAGACGPVSLAAIVSAFEDLPNAVSAADTAWTMSVLSRVQNGAPLAEAIAYEITALSVDSALDSQRRRLRGRGR